ncbi:MAG: hypothetical protein KAX20_08005, partial [Candidatus Omnitrophica bacterium]|nr:hypothetical protein [Candidatus Omnitrophota bacterium]
DYCNRRKNWHTPAEWLLRLKDQLAKAKEDVVYCSTIIETLRTSLAERDSPVNWWDRGENV